MKRLSAVLLVSSLLMAEAPGLAADVPMLLNYQGRLTDATGNPQTGTFIMTFAVFDAETGGTQLPAGTPWAETQTVDVVEGVFNVLLGSVTPLPPDLFIGGPADARGPLRFLDVVIDGEPLSPRARVASGAYAIRADTARFAETPTVTGPPGPQGPPGPIKDCRICFRWQSDDDAGQCNSKPFDGTSPGNGTTCAPIDTWTARYRDDTDGRNGGCRMSWKIDCTPPFGD